MTYCGPPVDRWVQHLDRRLGRAEPLPLGVQRPPLERRRSADGGAASGALRLVTWNVWFGTQDQEERACGLLAEALAQDPDFLFLQEVTDTMHEAMLQSKALRARLAPTESFLPSLDGYDVALWVAPGSEVLSCWTIPFESSMQRRCLVADVHVLRTAPDRPLRLRVATAHLESTKGQAAARAKQLRTALARLPSEAFPGGGSPDATLLAGDFNFCASWSENSLVAGEPDVVDLWAALRPGDPGYTEDTDANGMLLQKRDGEPKRVRFDRVLSVRSAGPEQGAPVCLEPEHIALLGTSPLPGRSDVWASDHFGLVAELSLSGAGGGA